MLRKRVGISVGAKLVQQLRRALDAVKRKVTVPDGRSRCRRHHARAAIHVDGTHRLWAPVNGPLLTGRRSPVSSEWGGLRCRLGPIGVRCERGRRAVAVLYYALTYEA